MGTLFDPVVTWTPGRPIQAKVRAILPRGLGAISAADWYSLYWHEKEGSLRRAVLLPREKMRLWLPPLHRERRR